MAYLFRVGTCSARAKFQMAALLSLCMTTTALLAQSATIPIPAGTPLPVKLNRHVPMKVGEPLQCALLYPVYAQNKLLIPAGSIARGSVVALRDDRSRRIHARLWGDFTPYRIPVVRFDQLMLPDGLTKLIVSQTATDGAPVLHLSTPKSSRSRAFIVRQIDGLKDSAKQSIAFFTAPGREDRLVQLFYRQLPYHPQRIETGTLWTVTLAKPIALPPYRTAGPSGIAQSVTRSETPAVSTATSGTQTPRTWHLNAYLKQTISSRSGKRGNTFEAVVAEPVFNRDHTIAVPEGSVLLGTITQSKPARYFGRSGKLRFDFRELEFPNAPTQHVLGTLAGVDAGKSMHLNIDSEGGVQSRPQNRVVVPVVLTFLGGRALDNDGIFQANAAVASNGFGIVGRVAGIVSGSREFAAGIGFWAAGLSVYDRWLTRGKNVTFVKNTRIEVTAVPTTQPLTATPAPGLPKRP